MNLSDSSSLPAYELGQVPRFASAEEAQAFLSAKGVKYVLAQFVDIHGVAKAKSVPLAHLKTVLNEGAGFAGFAIWGVGIEPNGPDFMAVGDLSTLTPVPWQPGLARIVCEGHVDGDAWAYDSRVTLKKQVERLSARGWTLFTGLEPEFSLLKRSVSGELVPCDPGDTLAKPCYDYKGLSRTRAYLEKLTEVLREVGIDVYQIDHEDANGQFEINYTYTDCLTSCDHYVFFKMAASELANEFGMICSFMPKPFANRPGNGMHMHMSIGDGRRNLFSDKTDPSGMGLSKLAYQFTAGLLAHAPALAALCNPTVNSYKRLVVGRSLTGATWAPAYISYGDNNRSTMVRVPGERIELRLPDGSCNPYLATAAVIAAGLDGVERELSPGDPANENLYTWSPEKLAAHGIGVLPQNLEQAIDALEADTLIRDALGPVADEFIKLKRMEWLEYMRHVSDWELKSYLEFF
ncbi:type III glutamate--ammonia ligase [Paraburkholderia caballeronis]|uniref:Gamma-glutamylmethylamide synthetase n=1 Tax=Paraburkholderia caballeronis TaxID=416943 RepID=A0A1H7VAJ5_9BURK|nr:type III glutamate--ammonia ligase [Paraburkholderia caballeronis]PXW16497.1 gamma-glutamylmethylamide synthetase [Paraburkholderia caballeronis]PXW94226.1 gamma-glutamylmethylamide synthetase [Paraburkholderia caballeronis]RAJ89747.1 gamma-glutamylmethylamide synthetase [Paraburkholderia caballeronis]SED94335.1 gamma-glutamylmethylamide synthetase [Paraburkholderia caballeronis]SEM06100.1 gamma-glutamylmethylamide synthetase [Paraburkholderia caballeronis]